MFGLNRLVVAIVTVSSLLSMSNSLMAQERCTAQPISYLSDGLRITGALMKPSGAGPFPVVVHNHGAKAAGVKKPSLPVGTPCFVFVLDRRLVYFVPDRRGFGRSEGLSTYVPASTNEEEIARAVRARMREEANDILAGVEFLKSLPFADVSRVALIGYSWGSAVTFRAASAGPSAFRAIVIQSTGTGERGYDFGLREMISMGRMITVPILIQHGRDDSQAPVRFSRELADRLRLIGKNVTLRTYPGYHNLFAPYPPRPEGDWGKDVLTFLTRYLR